MLKRIFIVGLLLSGPVLAEFKDRDIIPMTAGAAILASGAFQGARAELVNTELELNLVRQDLLDTDVEAARNVITRFKFSEKDFALIDESLNGKSKDSIEDVLEKLKVKYNGKLSPTLIDIYVEKRKLSMANRLEYIEKNDIKKTRALQAKVLGGVGVIVGLVAPLAGHIFQNEETPVLGISDTRRSKIDKNSNNGSENTNEGSLKK